MPTERMKKAFKDLDTIHEETGTELEELREAIEDVESIHEDHVQEMEEDKEFLEDLKSLFKEIRAVRKIEEHMAEEVEHYGEGDLSKKEFKQKFVKDEEKLEEVINQIRTEFEEIVRVLNEEERMTRRDEQIEQATNRLVNQLTNEEGKMENAHREVKSLVSGE